jgi:hypothetical protein
VLLELEQLVRDEIERQRRSRLANLSTFAEDATGELYLLSLDGDVYRFDPR